jgi:uncharacterized protein YndB with AHSA1/START domain
LTIEGEFHVVEPPHRLVYTWRAGEDGSRASLFASEPRGDATEVIVIHEQIPDEHPAIARGGVGRMSDGLERHSAAG